MNFYWVYSDGVWESAGYDPPEPPEPCDAYELVVAESPGKAKGAALRVQSLRWNGEYTDLRARLVKRDVPEPPGIYTYLPIYQQEVCQMHHNIRTCEVCPDYCADLRPCRDDMRGQA